MEVAAATPAEPDGPDPGAAPAVRASDDERQRVVDRLGEHAAAGRLTLAEWEERVGQAYAATTRVELATLTRDLPEPAPGQAAAESSRRKSRWSVAILGGSTWRGRRRLAGQLNLLSVLGGDDIDLREVEIEGNELVINAFSLLGGPNIYLPDTVELEVTGFSLLGGNDEKGSSRQPRPGAPVVRVRAFALLGGCNLWRLPAETRGMSLGKAKRAAKALPGSRD